MADNAFLVVRVTPRSARDEVVGWQGEELRVRLRAPPVEGQANAALLRLLAAKLDMSLSSVEIVSAGRGRVKRIRVRGLTVDDVKRRLRIG